MFKTGKGVHMFSVGDYVYYGTAGVCAVKDICASPFDKTDERLFYMLESCGMNSTTIYVPTENTAVVLRSLMTLDEAELFLSELRILKPLEVLNERQRREEYRNAIKCGTPTSLASVIKTVYERRQRALNEKRRVADTDADFDKIARHGLLGEISKVFDISEEEAEEKVYSAMNM